MIDLKLLKNNLKDIEKKINSRGESFDLSTIILDYEKKNSYKLRLKILEIKRNKFQKKLVS